MSRYTDMARTAWAAALPSWVLLMAEQCDQASQADVARRMRYSAAAIGEVLRRRWTGSYANVSAAFNGAFHALTVQCPVLGQIETQACLQHQRQPFAAVNPTRVRLYRACRAGCAHSRIAGLTAGKEKP